MRRVENRYRDVPPFGHCLAKARQQLGMNTYDMARTVGLQRANLSRLEAGYRSAHWDTVYRILVNGNLDLSLFFPADLILRAAESVLRQQREENASA